jgi:hypothetical protein
VLESRLTWMSPEYPASLDAGMTKICSFMLCVGQRKLMNHFVVRIFLVKCCIDDE